MAFSIAFGYVVILNVIGSSDLEFYPTRLLIGAACGVGVAMVFGSLYFFLVEPKSRKAPVAVAVPTHYARQVRTAVPA